MGLEEKVWSPGLGERFTRIRSLNRRPAQKCIYIASEGKGRDQTRQLDSLDDKRNAAGQNHTREDGNKNAVSHVSLFHVNQLRTKNRAQKREKNEWNTRIAMGEWKGRGDLGRGLLQSVERSRAKEMGTVVVGGSFVRIRGES